MNLLGKTLKGKSMFYFFVFVVGLMMVAGSGAYFILKRDYVDDFREKYNIYIATRDITVTTPAGSINLAVSRNDQEVAWKIYSQITTRVAVVDFNEDYDSFTVVNQSLYTVFGIIRDQIGNIPIERIRREKSDELVKFYTGILNEGIRPYLSKWHMPISKWVETQKAKHPESTIYELEKTFPRRTEILQDIKNMNDRMKKNSEALLKIVKAGRT